MPAYELAIRNFTVAEHLLELHENGHLTLRPQPGAPIPQAMLLPDDMSFLLRNAVIVACAAIESFFLDSVRDNGLTIARAMYQQGDDFSLSYMSLNVEDFLAMEKCANPDERLRQAIFKFFERYAPFYDSDHIETIAKFMNVRNFWATIATRCDRKAKDLRREIDEMFSRRIQIVCRADRPNLDADLHGDIAVNIDGHGLRAIHSAWVSTRIATARSLVSAANDCFSEELARLNGQPVLTT